MTTSGLAFLALIVVANAVPASVNKWDLFNTDESFDSCAATCSKQQKKFSYKTGSTYIYDYSVSTDTSMAGASEESAMLNIQARAEIQVLGVCEFALQLKGVSVHHTDGYTGTLRASQREEEFQSVLQASSLRFSFDDGVISSICPENGETTWGLNFKRGLLTAFQNSMNSLEKNHQVSEIDVSGECVADFTVTSSWNWKETRIKKTKNLLACSKRDNYYNMYPFIPYNVKSDVQSLPIIRSTHSCDLSISSSKVLHSTSCVETHMFVPFSNQESGGKTTVQQTLTLASQKDGVDADIGPVKNRKTLTFDHTDASKQNQNGPEFLEQKLKEICDQTQDDIRPETPRLFTELLQTIKVLSKSDLERIYKLVKDKVICPKNVRTMKFFMDALPMAESEGAVSLMTNLINNNQVEVDLAEAWLASIALIQEPTTSMAADGLKLLGSPSYLNAALPVSALVNNFCLKNKGCENDYYISQILTLLQSKVPRYCKVDDSNLKEVLLTLRAIGNTGLFPLTSSLDTCISSTSTPQEVRVSAADAYRRMSCDASNGQRDSSLWKVLSDSNQDFELRITSYMSVMRCPDDDTLSQISQLMEKNIDEHLGGFIYSHIKNLKETSDPLKQDIAKALTRYNFKEFSTNLFKYSSNYEASMLVKRYNLGFTADSNIIMSSNSPFPRSAMLNLTVDLFGNSVNLLEIGGRMEGIEILVEKLIGPTGYFTAKNKQSDSKLNDVRASFYTRVFGNEVLYEQTKGVQGLQAPSKMPNLLDVLMNFANRQTAAYTFSQQLMDFSLTIPTVAGLPLEITVNGSVNLDVKAEGKIDLRKVATSPRSMEIDGEIRPSAALEITGTMAVNALSTKMGLRMRNTMHSSTWLKGHIDINRGQVLNIEIEPPGDKMEIFNAKSQFFIVHDDIEKEQSMIKDNYQEYKLCSGDKLATLIGVELCGELKFPDPSYKSDAPYFPLTGPASLSIMTFRRDTHTTYKLLAMRKETKDSSIAKFLMDTPNSNVNRLISTDITITYNPDKQIDVALVSPWKKLNLNSAVVANKDIVSFVGSVLMDDSDKYGLTTEVKISKTGNSVTYSPFIELTQGAQTDRLLSGQVNLDLPNKLDANLEIKGLGMLPYNVEGGLINQEKQKQISFSLSKQGKNLYVVNVGSTFDISGKDNKNVKIEPTILVKIQDENLISITGSSDYKHDRSANGDITVDLYQMKPASLQWKVNKVTKLSLSNYNVDLKMKSSVLTGTIDGDFNQQKNAMSSTLKLTYNIPKFSADTITWSTKWNNKSNKGTFQKYIITSNLDLKKFTDYNTALTLRLDYKKKQTDVDLDIKYGGKFNDKKKVITFSSTLNKGNVSWKNADVGFVMKAKVPEKNVDLNLRMDHNHTPTKLDSNLNLKFSPYIKDAVDVGINLQDKSTKFISYLGQANLGIMRKKVAVNTELTQKSARHFQHTLNVQDFDGNTHLINSVYQSTGSNRHEVSADIKINGYQPALLQGKTTLDPLNFQAIGSAVYGNDVYNVSTQSKLTDAAKKFNFEFECPTRQVEAEVELKNWKDKVTHWFFFDWDAKRNTKSKVSMETSLRKSVTQDSTAITGTINVKTPFNKFEDLSAEGSYSMDPTQFSSKGKVSWGGKQETISSNVVVKLPLSLKKVDITFAAMTPVRQYREIELEINHKLDLTLASSIKGKLEDNEAEVTVKGENRGDQYNRDFLGLVNVKTPFAVIREASASIEHKDNGNSFKTMGALSYNANKYDVDLQMDQNIGRDNYENNGKLQVTWPEDQLLTTWQNKIMTDRQIALLMESKWSGNKRIVVDFIGMNNINRNMRHTLATLNLKTPIRSVRDISVKLENKLTEDKLESSLSVLNDKIEKIVYYILLEQNNYARNMIFLFKSPLYDHKIRGQMKAQWDTYPVTMLAWIEWAPWSRMDFDGSLNAPSVDNIAVNAKLTTPFKGYENIFAGVSHKLDNSEYLSQGRVSYGVRKAVILENKLRVDNDIIVLATKLTSPYGVHSLDSNYRLDVPFQFDATVKTPHENFENLGLILTFIPRETSLQSRIRVMYQLNKAVDSQLKLEWDKLYEGSLVVTTPFSNYENTKILARHNSNNRGFKSHGQVSLGRENAQGDVSYITSQSGTSGSASLTSSISGFEKFSAIFNVKGPLNQLKADASVNTEFNILATTFTNNINPGLLKSTLSITSRYLEDVSLSVQLKDASSYPATTLESIFNGQYGDKSIDAKAGVSYSGLEKIKGDLSLKTPFYSGQVNLENEISLDYMSGKGSLQTDVEAIGNIEVNYEKTGPLNNMASSAALIRNGEYLIKVSGKNNFAANFVFINVETEGQLVPKLTGQVDHKGSLSDFTCKTKLFDADGNVFEKEVVFKFEDSQLDLTSNFRLKFDPFDFRHTFTIHKEGTLTNFKINVNHKFNNDEKTAVLVFQADDDIKGLIEVNNLSDKYDKLGAEFEHSGDYEKFVTTGKVTISSSEIVSGKVNYYRYNLKRIEASAELSTPWDGYRYSSVAYRHENTDNRLSCNVNIQYGDGKKISTDLISQASGYSSNLSFNLKTPFKLYEDITMTGDYDRNKISAKAALGRGQDYDVSAMYGPDFIQYQLSTPLAVLKKVALNLRGNPRDVTADLLVLALNYRVQGNGAFQYTSPYKLSLSTQLQSNIPGYTSLQLKLNNNEDSVRGKTSQFLVSWDPKKQVAVDGRFFSGKSAFTSKQENILELSLKGPFSSFKTASLNVEHNVDASSIQDLLSVEIDQKKHVDMEVNFDTYSKYAYSAVVRKPWPMEYTSSYKYDDDSKEGDVYMNWNRDDPNSNIHIKSSLQNGASGKDNILTVTYTSPLRTMGIEHNLASSADKLSSSGKLFWDQDEDSKLTYSVDIISIQRRGDTTYNGDFKLGFLSRVVGVSGSLSNNDASTTADAAVNWDLGRDDSKKLQIQATLSGTDYTKADISIKLPSQTFRVDTALILNQDNIILNGKTDISYSRDTSKTLTLFSKLINRPTTYSYFSRSGNSFNYSVELGVSHPETELDMKIDSHLANSNDYLTSSLGVQYLTTRRQTKNLALFAEIDKIRRQINFVASGPSSSASVSGQLVSDEPLSVVVIGSLDGQKKLKSTLDVDASSKTLKFEIGQNDNLLRLKAFYPNSTTLQTELLYQKDNDNKQEAVAVLRLLNSKLLHSSVNWKPGMVEELSNIVTDHISSVSNNAQRNLRQISMDFQFELSNKYQKVTSSVFDDISSLMSFVSDESNSIGSDLDSLKLKLLDLHGDNVFFIKDTSSFLANNLPQDLNVPNIDDVLAYMKERVQTLQSFILASDPDGLGDLTALQDVLSFLNEKAGDFLKLLQESDLKITKKAKDVLNQVITIYDNSHVDYLTKKLTILKSINYLDQLNQALNYNANLKRYFTTISSWKDAVFDRVIPERYRDLAERTTNELHYQYTNLLTTSEEYLKEIIADELQEYINMLSVKNSVTVFDVKKGRIEATFSLPVELKYLDRQPDISPYVQQAKDVYNKYMPNMSNITKYLPDYSSRSQKASNDIDSGDHLIADLADFNPRRTLENRFAYSV